MFLLEYLQQRCAQSAGIVLKNCNFFLSYSCPQACKHFLLSLIPSRARAKGNLVIPGKSAIKMQILQVLFDGRGVQRILSSPSGFCTVLIRLLLVPPYLRLIWNLKPRLRTRQSVKNRLPRSTSHQVTEVYFFPSRFESCGREVQLDTVVRISRERAARDSFRFLILSKAYGNQLRPLKLRTGALLTGVLFDRDSAIVNIVLPFAAKWVWLGCGNRTLEVVEGHLVGGCVWGQLLRQENWRRLLSSNSWSDKNSVFS